MKTRISVLLALVLGAVLSINACGSDSADESTDSSTETAAE